MASVARDVHVVVVVVRLNELASLFPGSLGCPRLDVLFDVARIGTVFLELVRHANRLEPVNEGRAVVVGQSLRLWAGFVVHHQLCPACELDEQD